LDEIILMYKGKVDELRYQRNNAYLIHCSLVETKNRVKITEFNPLPFDEDFEEASDPQEMEKMYKELQQSGYFETKL
jgi:hypothetical protein